MYIAISTPQPGKPFSRQDYKNKESLYDKIMGDVEKDSNGAYHFEDRDELTLTISEHEELLRDLGAPAFGNLESAKMANEITERLKNCEAVAVINTEDLEPLLKG